VAFHPDGKLLAVLAEDRVVVADVERGTITRELELGLHGGSLAFSPRGETLFTFSRETLAWHDFPSGRQRHAFNIRDTGGPLLLRSGPTVSPSGRLVAVSQRHHVRAFDVETGASRYDIAVTGSSVVDGMVRAQAIEDLAFSPDGRYLAGRAYESQLL